MPKCKSTFLVLNQKSSDLNAMQFMPFLKDLIIRLFVLIVKVLYKNHATLLLARL